MLGKGISLNAWWRFFVWLVSDEEKVAWFPVVQTSACKQDLHDTSISIKETSGYVLDRSVGPS